MAGKGSGGGPRKARIAAHVALIEAPYYEDVAAELRAGAVGVLEAHGASYEHFTVPGALEIPQVLALLARSGRLDAPTALGPRIDGAIVIGCVIRGETSHYDIVCNNANHWLMETAIRHALPLGNAILTVDTREQALARARGGKEGKGGDAARACLRLIELARQLSGAAS